MNRRECSRSGRETPASEGAGGGCKADDPGACNPWKNGGTCRWSQDVFVLKQPE